MSVDSSAIDVQVENIDLFVGDTHALKDFSWTKRRGEHWAIMGRNGAGKSAFIKLLTGDIYPVDKPENVFNFYGMNRAKPGVLMRDIKALMGVVSPEFQSDYIPETPGLSVVLSGFFSSNGLYKDPTKEMIDKALEKLAELKISHLEERHIGSMSYGEARRLLIARALIHDPNLLVFDEPTNGLDMGASESFLETISELAENGYDTITVTHHLHEVLEPITHIGVIESGQITKQGEKADMVNSEMLEAVFGAHVEIIQRNGRYWAMPLEK